MFILRNDIIEIHLFLLYERKIVMKRLCMI